MLGLTSVTFRQLSVAEIVALAAANGAECIEWGGDIHVTDTAGAKTARTLCAESSIAVNSYGSYYRPCESDPGDFERVCEITRELSAKSVRAWLGRLPSGKTKPDEFARLTEYVHRMADTAQQYGLKIGFEFHNGTYNDTQQASEKFFSALSRPEVFSYWQPRYTDGFDCERLKKMADSVGAVHIFYWDMFGTRKRLLRDSGGRVEEFLKILKASRFCGDILIEFVKGASPESYAADAAFLKEKWEALG